MDYIDPQDLVPHIQVKSVYWDLEHMKRPTPIKFDILFSILRSDYRKIISIGPQGLVPFE